MLDDEKVAVRRRTSAVHVFVVDDHPVVLSVTRWPCGRTHGHPSSGVIDNRK